MQEMVRVEVFKLLQVGIIYPISDSPWVSLKQVVPKKSGITVVQNDKGEEVSTCLTSGWRVCIDYRKQNAVTRKDHFPLSFIDQVLERVSSHPSILLLLGWLLRVFSNRNCCWRSGDDHFHLSIQNLCIQKNVFRWYVPNWCISWFVSSQWSPTTVPFDSCLASVPWLRSSDGSNQQNL